MKLQCRSLRPHRTHSRSFVVSFEKSFVIRQTCTRRRFAIRVTRRCCGLRFAACTTKTLQLRGSGTDSHDTVQAIVVTRRFILFVFIFISFLSFLLFFLLACFRTNIKAFTTALNYFEEEKRTVRKCDVMKQLRNPITLRRVYREKMSSGEIKREIKKMYRRGFIGNLLKASKRHVCISTKKLY